MAEKYGTVARTSYGGRGKKSHKALKIVLGILAAVIVILLIVFAVNYKTITLAMGKGKASVVTVSQAKKSLTGNSTYSNVKETSDSGGNEKLSGTSSDGAVTFTVTQQKDGTKDVTAQVDLKKMGISDIKSDLKSGNLSAIKAAKDKADKYVSPLVPQDQLTGMEAYIMKEAYQQYKSGKDNISVSRDFGGTTVNISGDLKSGKLNLEMKQP